MESQGSQNGVTGVKGWGHRGHWLGSQRAHAGVTWSHDGVTGSHDGVTGVTCWVHMGHRLGSQGPQGVEM